MSEILSAIQPWTAALASILSLGALGFILKVHSQLKDVYAQRVEAVKEKAAVIEERLKSTEEELKRLEKINDNVNTIGASLGIESFKEQLPPGVTIRDIGDNFSGKIAGRDINEVLNRIGKVIDNSEKNIERLVDNSNRFFTSAIDDRSFEYTMDFMFERGTTRIRETFNEKIRTYNEGGWGFYGITSDYNGTDGCILIFRRRLR